MRQAETGLNRQKQAETGRNSSRVNTLEDRERWERVDRREAGQGRQRIRTGVRRKKK